MVPSQSLELGRAIALSISGVNGMFSLCFMYPACYNPRQKSLAPPICKIDASQTILKENWSMKWRPLFGLRGDWLVKDQRRWHGCSTELNVSAISTITALGSHWKILIMFSSCWSSFTRHLPISGSYKHPTNHDEIGTAPLILTCRIPCS